MGSNSLKNKQSDCDVSATHTGLRPADFPLRSVESRAAARALIQRFSDQREPRDGDVIVCIPSLDSPVASEIYRQATHPGTAPITDAESRIWIKLPTGLIREEGPETYKLPDLRKVSDNFLLAIIAAKPLGDPSGFRNVKIFLDELLDASGNLEAQ